MKTEPDLNWLTEQIIGAGIEVHRTLGPGLLESVYEECLSAELWEKSIPFERPIPLASEIQIENIGLRLSPGSAGR
jgi:GxxExxY protein